MDNLAERVAYAIIGRGLDVFFDKHNLPPGVEFDARIQRELESASVLVFLITEKAVTPANYTLTELKFASGKWRNPSGRVLPVMVRETNIDSVPQYLRTVQILKPVGDIAAEVADDVAKLIKRIRVRKLAASVGVVGVLALAVGAGAAYVGLLGGTFRIYHGYVLNDAGEVKARDEVGGFENCLSLCQRDEECNAFSYFPNGSCTLTRTYEQIVPRRDGRFGVRAGLAQPQINRLR
jgi:hypothetical protein